MAYFLFKSTDTVTPFTVINDETMDTTSASIAFVGKRRVDYGESQQQNQLWMLENFAAPTPPERPLSGQLWYDTITQAIKVYNGANFVRVANTNVSIDPPTTPTDGQLWFNDQTQQLNIWNGTSWVIVGPTDDALAYAIVFGG